MDSVSVERLDPLGVVASVSKDLGITEMIDTRGHVHDQEEISAGEAVAGMILNGLGCFTRPLSFTPQVLANKPLDLLFHASVKAEMCNRFKLGRTLDEVHAYGGDLWFREVALAVCAREGLARRFHPLATPSFSLTGDSVPDSEEHAMAITQGDAKDPRAEVKPAVLELMVAPDGGVPMLRKSWDGNASATTVFQERARALLTTLQHSPGPRYVVADCKLCPADNAQNGQSPQFITRIPTPRKVVSPVMTQALEMETWPDVGAQRRYQRLELCHEGLAQRWLGVFSQAAARRAEATVSPGQQRKDAAIQKQLLHLQAQRFASESLAQEALSRLGKKWPDHQRDS